MESDTAKSFSTSNKHQNGYIITTTQQSKKDHFKQTMKAHAIHKEIDRKNLLPIEPQLADQEEFQRMLLSKKVAYIKIIYIH